MTARDLARFGLLFLRQGEWEGRRVVPEDWVRDSVVTYSDAGERGGYGYLWWTENEGRHLPGVVVPEGTPPPAIASAVNLSPCFANDHESRFRLGREDGLPIEAGLDHAPHTMKAARFALSTVCLLVCLASAFPSPLLRGEIPQPTRDPLFRLIDLDVGEEAEVPLSDGTSARVKLLHLEERRDSVRKAVREAIVTVEVNGEKATVSSAVYHLPVELAGLRIDCPVTKGRYEGVAGDPWGLEKDARLRLWPGGSPLIEPETFGYPLKQRWFASATSMANEPIDAGAVTGYVYHYDLDFGGAEKLTEVIAATDGLVVSSANQTLPGYEDTPVSQRYDVVYLLDDRGFYYRYSHFHRIAPEVRAGERVVRGQVLGLLGKEGGSGGWAHLHFGLWTRMPSGKWGSLDSYPLVWEAYLREEQPAIIAVARPQHLVFVGEPVVLDGSKSWSASGEIAAYEWSFGDGQTATGARVERTYPAPGRYSEILRVEDEEGRVDYDFVRVLVVDPADPETFPPNVHAAFWPSQNVRAGDTITLKVRSFRTTEGEERIDFGDGSEVVTVKSGSDTGNLDPQGYASVVHRYREPGDYVVRIDRSNERAWPAFTHLHIRVEAK